MPGFDFNIGDLRETARVLRDAADDKATCPKWPERRAVTLRRHQLIEAADSLDTLLVILAGRT